MTSHRIDDTRVRVNNAAYLAKTGRTPDQILSFYPQLSLGQVHGALAYYYDHREEIEAELADDEDMEQLVELLPRRVSEGSHVPVVPGRFPLYTDADVHGPIVTGLIDRGWDVLRAVDAHPQGTDDDVHFETAAKLGRVLVANDKDQLLIVLRWIEEARPFCGCVVWRQKLIDRFPVSAINVRDLRQGIDLRLPREAMRVTTER